MTTILVFAVVISVLVMVHELGHHLTAKWFGVPVEVFSVGFGPRLASVRYAETEYRISAIPFGGYVKMAGTTGPGASPQGFESKTPWQRFVILLAGPVMNVAFAFGLTTVALWCGVELPAYRTAPAVAGDVVANSSADRAGVRAGDEIVAVGGEAVSNWSALDTELAGRRNQNVSLTVRRGNARVDVQLPAELNATDAFAAGIVPDAHPVVRSVSPGVSAQRAGLRPGDVIVAIDGQPTDFTTNVASRVTKSGGDASLTILRDGQVFTATVEEPIGVVALVPTALYRPEPIDAFGLGARAIAASTGEILGTVRGLATGNISPQHLIGPVGLAQMTGESSQLGWRAVLAMMAFISLNLGICNLIPIPILDGGQMLMLLIEGVSRRDVPVRLRKALVGAGAAAMFLLLITTFFNDLGRLGWL